MIKIYSPTRDNVVTGNYVTAKRYAYHLQNLGHRVFACNGFEEKVNAEGVRCAFVLHAEKGFHVVKELAAKNIPVVLVLTGTDLYRDIISTKNSKKEHCLRSIQLASAIVVLHENAVSDLLKVVSVPRDRIFVVLQSVVDFKKRSFFFKKKNQYKILLLSNIRKEKGIIVAISGFLEFQKNIDARTKFTLDHIGGVLDQGYFKKITNLLEGVKSVSFLGSIEKEKLQTILASYDLLLHSSFIEGGSLVIQEAHNAGLPIIASDISCHTALLGSAYVGLHSVGSAKGVSEKLHAFFFDELCRKQMEIQLASCPAAGSTLRKEQEELRKVLSYIQV